MSSVGIIANPLAGKDIRRLVSQAIVVSNQEKSNILRRVFSGLLTMGVKKIFVMPDISDLTRQAREDVHGKIEVEILRLGNIDQASTSTLAFKYSSLSALSSFIDCCKAAKGFSPVLAAIFTILSPSY